MVERERSFLSDGSDKPTDGRRQRKYMTSFQTFIIEQAKAGNLPSLFRAIGPKEGNVQCFHATPDKRPEWAAKHKTPDHCLQQVGPGSVIRNFFGDFSEWTDEDRCDGHGDLPDCLHCEVREMARDIEKALADVRLFVRFELEHLLECVLTGLVDPDELLGRIDPALGELGFLDSDLTELLGQVWALDEVEKLIPTGRPSTDFPISVWAEEARKAQDEKVKALIASGDERDSDLAKMLVFCASEMDFPARAMSLLLKASKVDDKQLSHLVWLKGWMEFMSRKGSKVTFHRGTEPMDMVEDMPFPEEGRQQACSNLTRLGAEIRKRVAELSR